MTERLRRTAAKVVLVGALATHALLLVRAESDPHKLFGSRPFNESDSWRFDVVRVHADGSRHPVDDGTWAHRWNELIGANKLLGEGRTRHAAAGAPASVDFLERALDWAVDNIPDDTETVALEAQVAVCRNGRGDDAVVQEAGQAECPDGRAPEQIELRSER